VRLNVRHVDGTFEGRDEQEWPLARTRWTRFHLDARIGALAAIEPAEPGSVEFDAAGHQGATFWLRASHGNWTRTAACPTDMVLPD
jgi:hypothetical protein